MNAVAAGNGWQSFRLRDVVYKLVDGSHNPPPKQDHGRPMLSARNIDQGQITFDDFRYISPESFEAEHARTRVAPGDVLLTIVGTIGRSAVVPEGIEPFALQRSVAVLSLKEGLLPKFLAYQIQSPQVQRHFEQHARGTVQKGVYLKTLSETPILVPPVLEQYAIVVELEKQFSRLDDAVANLKRAKANLRRYSSRVHADAVDGWPTRPLGSLLREPLRNGHSAKATDDPSGLRAFTLTAVTQGDFSERNTKRTVANAMKVAGLWAQTGDIYIERSNTPELVGTARLYRGPSAFAFIPDLFIRVRVDESTLSPEFAQIALRTERARRYFRAKAQGIAGSMPKIDQGVVEGFEMPLPVLSEQERIVAEVDCRLSVVGEVDEEINENVRRANTVRSAILTRAFAKGPERTSACC